MMNTRGQSGFTLIEVLVALAILSLLAAGVVESARYGERSLVRVERMSADADEALRVQRLLRNILTSTYPLMPSATPPHHFGIESDGRVFRVTAPSTGLSGGLWRYQIESTPEGALLIRAAPDRNGGFDSGAGPVLSEVVLQHLKSVHWRFLGTVLNEPGSEPRWIDQWQDRIDLPALVQLNVEFAPNDPRSWPLFLVHPRIANNSQCQFDAIAQRCRAP